ncbi:MAG: ABC transporter permease [Bacteroidetes bacterium]|nr:ABC transporter permease [Bacteroidota bacterium]
MFKNYLKIAWRNLVRNKGYSTLNILGLATGMAVALLIGLWVYYQYSYDKFLPGYQQAYQVKFNITNNGLVHTQDQVCLPLESVLKNDIPEIAYLSTSFGPLNNNLVRGEKKLRSAGLSTGADFLKIFQYPMIRGNAAEALKNPNSIVLTESTAHALFGDLDPIGQIIENYGTPLKVTGILKDLPRNSSLQFNCLTVFTATDGWLKDALTDWKTQYFNLYLSLRPDADVRKIESRTKLLVNKYAPAMYSAQKTQITMQSLKDRHLYTEYKNGIVSGGVVDYVIMFGIIGLFVLLIACINFTNLSTARSEKRAREVGIRKVAGSTRNLLILQFIVESVITTFVAFLFSLVILQLALPYFNTLTKSDISIPYSNSLFWMLMTAYVLVTGLVAGSRPAFYLSSFQPVKVLKGRLQTKASASFFRKTLVVVQFSCSVALIIGTVTVYRQIHFAKERPMGYDPNRLIYSEAAGNYKAIKSEAFQTGMITDMTKCLSPVTDVYSRNIVDDWSGKLPGESMIINMQCVSDADYFKTLGMKFISGNNFFGDPGHDSLCAIINQTAAERMHLKDPLNKEISWSLTAIPHRLRITGVVKDAMMNSPFGSAEPTIFVYQPQTAFTFMYRLAPTVNTGAALEKLKPIFEKYSPTVAYEPHFVDETYAMKFDLETLVGKLTGIFAGLAILISCLGLLGLAAYMAEQRTKEIGIRKVLGASVSQIWLLLSKEFIVLVLISCVIASPFAFYFLQNWLQKYDYRISIGVSVFVISAVLAIAVTLITVSFQAIKAAMANPVKSLRSE